LVQKVLGDLFDMLVGEGLATTDAALHHAQPAHAGGDLGDLV